MNTTGYTGVQRPVLPLGHGVEDLVGDRGDRLPRDLGAVDLGQVRLHLAGRGGPLATPDEASELKHTPPAPSKVLRLHRLAGLPTLPPRCAITPETQAAHSNCSRLTDFADPLDIDLPQNRSSHYRGVVGLGCPLTGRAIWRNGR
jgi:hypothetical protein